MNDPIDPPRPDPQRADPQRADPQRATRPALAALERFAAILARKLVGTHIERVWRPEPTSLLIDLRALGKARLFASLSSRHPWVAVTTRWPETPAAPDRETLLLRKHLEGARVTAVHVEDARRLVLELTRSAPHREASASELAPRDAHEPVLALQLAGRYANAAVIDLSADPRELVKLIADRPAIDPDSPPLPRGDLHDAALDDDRWLEAEAARAWAAEDARRFESRRAALAREARQAQHKKTRALAALDADLAKARGAESLRAAGELLKASLHRVKPGMSTIDVVDWGDPEQRTITLTLEPTLTPAENLQRVFARYRKLARGEAAIAARRAAAEREAATFEALAARIERAQDDDDTSLDALERELRALGVRAPVAPRVHESAERLPYRRFVAADGSEILVGKSAKDNDDLTFHVARGSDVFLHARDVPGSHVILRRRGKAEPSSVALLDAAALAAWASKLRDELVVDVLFTERKHVRKPRGAAPGLVQTAAVRTLVVRRDPERIQRLYATLDVHERDA